MIGGCDGAEFAHNYYTDFADQSPDDTLILTLGCGKFGSISMNTVTSKAFPRLLDLGQCNDSYSAIKIATALAAAFEVEVNDLPLSLIISWFEQKASSGASHPALSRSERHPSGTDPACLLSPNVIKLLVRITISRLPSIEERLDAILQPA
ncbi:MAG: hypothetical protein R3F51_19170 [Cyanobacteriota/Melainabacteria group bacterium]